MIAELVQRAQAGETAAFAELYVTYRSRVYAHCMRLLKNTHDAEDCTQDVFFRAYRKLKLFRGEASFYTWLFAITVTTALMRGRKHKGKYTVSLDDEDPDLHQFLVAQPALVFHDQRLEGTVDRIALERAIDTLAPGQRTIFELQFIDGLDQTQIAALYGCSKGNCKSQTFKAKRNLRDELTRKRPLHPVRSNP